MCLESCEKFDAMSCKYSYFHFADLIILSLIEVNLSLFLFFFYPKIPCNACIGTQSAYRLILCLFFFFLKNENFLVPFYSL